MAYKCTVSEIWRYFCIGMYCVYVVSLHIESTDSMIWEGSRFPCSHASAGSFQEMGGSEQVRAQHRLCVLGGVRVGMGCMNAVTLIAWWVPITCHVTMSLCNVYVWMLL